MCANLVLNLTDHIPHRILSFSLSIVDIYIFYTTRTASFSKYGFDVTKSSNDLCRINSSKWEEFRLTRRIINYSRRLKRAPMCARIERHAKQSSSRNNVKKKRMNDSSMKRRLFRSHETTDEWETALLTQWQSAIRCLRENEISCLVSDAGTTSRTVFARLGRAIAFPHSSHSVSPEFLNNEILRGSGVPASQRRRRNNSRVSPGISWCRAAISVSHRT